MSLGLLANGYVLKKSANDSASLNTTTITSSGVIESKTIVQNQMTATEYDEIDQIYDYVRGLASLPKNLNNYESLTESSSPQHQKLLPHSHTPQKNHHAAAIVDMRLTTSSSSSKVNSHNKRENHLFNSDSWIKHELLEKPIPPSIKNLPSKKQLAHKRPTLIFTRTNNNNNNLNNCSSSHGPKISSPQKDSNELSPQSPLFHIR